MKLITEYTKQELIKLKPAEVEKIVHLHLANDGVAIPREPKEPEYEKVPEKDKTLFYISGINSIFFEKRSIADEIAQVLRNNYSQLRRIKTEYLSLERNERVMPWTPDEYSFKEPSVTDIIVMEKAVYSVDLYLQIKAKLEANSKLKDNYDKQSKEYEEAQRLAKSTIDMVWETVRDAQREQEEKDSKLAVFKEYLALADGDVDIAWKFIKKAHTVTQEQEDYINASIKS